MKTKDLEQLKNYLSEHPNINGHEDFFKSAVLVLLFEKNGELHFILQERNIEIRQGGEICFPGGKIDNSETPVETALRETYEELGITSDKLKILGQLDKIVSPLGAIINAIVAYADINDENDLTINKAEVHKVFTIPVSFFIKNKPEVYQIIIKAHSDNKNENGEQILLPVKELGLPEIYAKPWGGSKYNVYIFKTEYGPVWGITAKFILDFVKRYNKTKNG